MDSGKHDDKLRGNSLFGKGYASLPNIVTHNHPKGKLEEHVQVRF